MRLWPRTLGPRIGATLALAALAVVALDFAVKQADAGDRPGPRPTWAFAAPALPPPVRLAAVSGPVLLGVALESVPAAAAPVVQVFADGSYALRRPEPLPSGPETPASAPAVVLPGGSIRELDSRARATFVEILGALIAERPVTPERFVTLDFRVELDELLRVLAWIR